MMGTKIRSFSPLSHDLPLEDLVIAAGQNIKRLLDFLGRGPRKLAQVEALCLPAPTPPVNGRLLRGSHRRRSTPLLARFSTRWVVLRTSDVRLSPKFGFDA